MSDVVLLDANGRVMIMDDGKLRLDVPGNNCGCPQGPVTTCPATLQVAIMGMNASMCTGCIPAGTSGPGAKYSYVLSALTADGSYTVAFQGSSGNQCSYAYQDSSGSFCTADEYGLAPFMPAGCSGGQYVLTRTLTTLRVDVNLIKISGVYKPLSVFVTILDPTNLPDPGQLLGNSFGASNLAGYAFGGSIANQLGTIGEACGFSENITGSDVVTSSDGGTAIVTL